MRTVLLIGFIFAGLLGCRQPPPELQPAFYYWRTVFQISDPERRFLDAMECRRLYVKFLDIDWVEADGKPGPVARLEVADTSGIGRRKIIPCVFITNRTFGRISAGQLRELSARMAETLLDIYRGFGGAGSGPAEIQFDCDWTPSTQSAYFSFLRQIRSLLPSECRISATIRLHQYKFPEQTGVPPVDRGMLMFYNTGDIDRLEEENSIFRTAAARRYLYGVRAAYPLELDLALPVFSWALVYREGALWKIIPEPGMALFADPERFHREGRMIRVLGGSFAGGHYLRAGDQVRVETITPAMLDSAAVLASEVRLAESANLAFFHLDSTIVARYSVKDLQGLGGEIRRKR